jgi:hypothetical protein
METDKLGCTLTSMISKIVTAMKIILEPWMNVKICNNHTQQHMEEWIVKNFLAHMIRC